VDGECLSISHSEVARNVYKQHAGHRSQRRCFEVFDEVRPEMKALIYLMIGLSMLGIGIILGQAAFAIGFLGPP
jgi:hypothetical protein